MAPWAIDSTGVHERLTATLLTLLDGVDAGAEGLALVATSRGGALDERVTRPGRLDRRLRRGG